MKSLFSLLLIALASTSLLPGQWVELNNTPAHNTMKFQFVTESVGYVMAQKNMNFSTREIIKTTDGGGSWTALPLPDTTSSLLSVSATSENNLYAIMRILPITGPNPTKVYRTTNDGSTWSDVTPDSTHTGFGTATSDFVDDLTGYWGVGHHLYKTTDGGANWTSWTLTMQQNPEEVHFWDKDHGIVGYWDGTFLYQGGMLVTSDGGQTWHDTLVNTANSQLEQVWQASATVAYASSGNSNVSAMGLRLLKTTNSGLSWDSIPVPDSLPNVQMTCFQFINAQEGMLVAWSDSTSYEYRTVDGGNSWTFRGAIGQARLSQIQLIGNTGYLGEAQNQIFKNTNIGLSVTPAALPGVKLFPNPFADQLQFALDHGEPGIARLYSLQGQLLKSRTFSGQGELMTRDLAAGMYLLRLESGGQTQSFRVVKP